MGPIFGIFFLGICNDRANAQGAKVAIGFSTLLCAYLQACEMSCPNGCSAETPTLFRVGSISSFWFIVITSVATVLVGSVASLCWDAPEKASTAGLTYRQRSARAFVKTDPLLGTVN